MKDHLVKLCTAKIGIRRENMTAINQKGYAIPFMIYSAEVDKMMEKKISPEASFYDVLLMKERDLLSVMKSFKEKKEWGPEDFKGFPAYADIIKLKLERAIAKIQKA